MRKRGFNVNPDTHSDVVADPGDFEQLDENGCARSDRFAARRAQREDVDCADLPDEPPPGWARIEP